MNDKLSKDYIDERVVKLIESIGYKHRVGNSYVIIENDGYINISSYIPSNNEEIIEFHKNFTRTIGGNYVEDIHEEFDNYNDFVKFIENHHKQAFRKIKIEKLNNLNN